jgi:hypothetical protein
MFLWLLDEAMMKSGGMEIQLHILNMEMGGHLHSHYGCSTTRVGAPVILRIGWVGSTASLDAVVKRKVYLFWESVPILWSPCP